MDISNVLYLLILICWIIGVICLLNDDKTFALVCVIFSCLLFVSEASLRYTNENTSDGLNGSEVMLDDKFNYKAELKSGEIVDASMCMTSDNKSTCLIHIDGEVKDYVVASYEKKDER